VANAHQVAVALPVSQGVPCLWPGCNRLVAFGAIEPDRRRRGTCPLGHRHYADDDVRYGTDGQK
jgi:hypothetical protein